MRTLEREGKKKPAQLQWQWYCGPAERTRDNSPRIYEYVLRTSTSYEVLRTHLRASCLAGLGPRQELDELLAQRQRQRDGHANTSRQDGDGLATCSRNAAMADATAACTAPERHANAWLPPLLTPPWSRRATCRGLATREAENRLAVLLVHSAAPGLCCSSPATALVGETTPRFACWRGG